jgi:hypothetical protein
MKFKNFTMVISDMEDERSKRCLRCRSGKPIKGLKICESCVRSYFVSVRQMVHQGYHDCDYDRSIDECKKSVCQMITNILSDD